MSKHGRALAFLVVAALAVSMIAVAGCGTTTPPTTGTGTTEPPAATYKLVTAGQLTVGSDTTFPPFESMDGNNAVGFDVDLVNAMAKEMKITKVVFLSEIFDSLIPTLKAGGKFDIIASGMTIKAERQLEIDFTEPYFDSNQSVAMKTGGVYTKPEDLKGKKVGVQSGTTGASWAEENLKPAGAEIVQFKDTAGSFAALQAGNVAAVVNDLPVTAEMVKDTTKGLAMIAQIPTGEQYGFAVSKENPDLLKAMNAALAAVKASGEYDTIYRKWFGDVPK
ncbi:MAG TPA: basic amino acid ABC transporter substrate-binding protein [Coriobacteriia bacterium]